MTDEKKFKRREFVNSIIGVATLEAFFYACCIVLFKGQTAQIIITIVFLFLFLFSVLLSALCCCPKGFRNILVLFSQEILGSSDVSTLITQELQNSNRQISEEISDLGEKYSELDENVNYCVSSVTKSADRADNIESEITDLSTKVKEYLAENVLLKARIAKLENALKNWNVAEAGDRRVLAINGAEFAFRYCPAGKSAVEKELNDDKTERPLALSEGFWICEVPTTQEQWNATGFEKSNECCFKGNRLPVENVSWNESMGFVQKLNEDGYAPDGWLFDLPYSEEWEYACRAGTTGDDHSVPLDEYAWYVKNSDGHTHDVGSKKPDVWNIYDMLGNVWEWTKSKVGPSFVDMGGSWYDDAQFCCPAFPDLDSPTRWCNILGFRCVLVRRL